MNERDVTTYVNRLLDTVPDSPAPLAEVLADGERARRRRLTRGVSVGAAVAVGIIGLVATAAMVGNDTDEPAPSSERTQDPAVPAQWDLGVLVYPESATPGSLIELTYPDENMRGIAFSLAPWTGTEWGEVEYYLTATQVRSKEPTWWPATENGGWDDLGVGGPGPDFLTIPDSAPPGGYLLCSANAKEQFCVVVQVDERATPSTNELASVLDCNQFSSNAPPYSSPPQSAAEAREQGWPDSPDAAAHDTVNAPAFRDRLAQLELGPPRAASSLGGHAVFQYVLTDQSGATLATLQVEELFNSVWATTQTAICS
jgi:hypothetical protein